MEKDFKKSFEDINEEEKEDPVVKFEPSALGRSVAIKRQKKIVHGPEWMPHPLLGIILGRSGCGKSYILGSIAPQIKELCHVVVLTPIVKNEVYQSLGNYFTKQNIKFEICGDMKSAQGVLGNAIDGQEKGKYGLCIMDDFNSGQRGASNCSGNNVLTSIYTKIRNYDWHCIILCQDISFIPTRARTNANMWVIFQQNNTYSINMIMRDLPNLVPDVTPDELSDLFDTLKQDRHAFMLASVCHDDNPRIYVANKDTDMKLRVVNFNHFDEKEDPQLNKIIKLVTEHPSATSRRLARNYLDFIENQYGLTARKECVRSHPILKMQ